MPADINSNYYIMTSYGGWSPCIQGNNAHGLRPFSGSVLPNCVGYCVGRWNELMNLGACTYLGNRDDKWLYSLAISQGCTASNTPAVGSLMVWGDLSDPDDDGHAAIIEVVNSSTQVVASESGWNYTSAPIVRNITRNYSGGSWGSSKPFLGFVEIPIPISPITDADIFILLAGRYINSN